ncbi:MAG: transglycosylase domain-containing protein, partial [Duncaniella sp.]|nr:transglycosylase domain-containing protein [Duncaniella sp.]
MQQQENNYRNTNDLQSNSKQRTSRSGKKNPKGKKPRRYRGLIVTLWVIFASAIVGIFLFLFFVYNGVIGYMPAVEELKNPTDRFASVLYSSDGKEIGRYFVGTGNRVYADFDEVSPHVIDALISTEDVRFEEHSGIDMRGLGRVLFKTLLLGNKNAGGGSTLTQQLAKQLYSPN